NLPAGLSIDPATGVISGLIGSAAAQTSSGVYSSQVTVQSSAGGSNTRTFSWTVTDTDRAPVMNALAARSNAENDTIMFSVGAFDPDGDVLTYSAANLPEGVSINPATGLILGTISYEAAQISAGSYLVSVTVADGHGQSASQSFTWSVTN